MENDERTSFTGTNHDKTNETALHDILQLQENGDEGAPQLAVGDTHGSDEDETKLAKRLTKCRSSCSHFYDRHPRRFKILIKCASVVAIAIYLSFAIAHSFGDQSSIEVVVICCLAIVLIVASIVRNVYGPRLSKIFQKRKEHRGICSRLSLRTKKTLYWGCFMFFTVSLFGYVVIDTAIQRPGNLMSLIGMVVLVLFMFLTSKHPEKVPWRVVVWGLMLQFVFGMLVIKTNWGYAIFKWMSDQLTNYIGHSKVGSVFVFGKNYSDHYFAFGLMPTLVMFSATISVLYYMGIMKVIIHAISFVIRKSLGTGPMETLHATFNIFVGWAETIAIVKPLLKDMTLSELHAIMANGFATVSGGTMAAYILYGAPANHLLAASFMSAPAALALSKLYFPETYMSRTKRKTPEIIQTDRNVIGAASSGAISAIPLVAYILVHIFAFVSILDFFDSTLAWLGDRIGIEPPHYPVLSFQYVCSYLMSPLGFILGVDWPDVRVAGRMLGIKLFVTEFIAFRDLGIVIENSAALRNYTDVFPNSTWWWTDYDDVFLNATGETLIGGVMSERSAVITTYAMCGFSDLIALGMMIGALTAASPDTHNDILKVAPRALITGLMSSFLTAAMAGLLVES